MAVAIIFAAMGLAIYAGLWWLERKRHATPPLRCYLCTAQIRHTKADCHIERNTP
jgi:hypothetical protein